MTTLTTVPVLREPERVNLDGQDTGDRECLSHTRLGVFLACNQKYHWNYEQRLEPAVKKTSLQMGAAFAHALEHNDPQAGFQQVMRDHADQTAMYAGNPWVVVPDREAAEIAATTVLAASGAYLRHYGHTDTQREQTLRARIRNPATGAYSRTFDVQARIDGLADTRLIEDKFVGQIDPATDRRLLLDRQVTLGCYLLWRCRGIEVSEVAYRMTKKPSIRRRQNESHNEYLERLVTDYIERPDFYLHEFTLTRTPDDFLRLEQELWTWCEQIRAARRDGVFPRNVAACSEFGGCPYLPLCCREPGALHQFAERERTEVENTETQEVTPHAA